MILIAAFAAGALAGYAYGRELFTFAGVAERVRAFIAKWKKPSA